MTDLESSTFKHDIVNLIYVMHMRVTEGVYDCLGETTYAREYRFGDFGE
jgi:hypothetical protein